MARPLLKLSVLLKHQMNVPKYLVGYKYCHTVIEPKPQPNEAPTGPLTSKDLRDKLAIVDHPSNLISSLESNKASIESCHVIAALTSMQKYYQVNQMDHSEVQSDTQFLKMCYILNKNLLRLELHESLQALKILNLLKVPSNTSIVQSLLQLIRSSINALSLAQLYFLSFMLKLMERTHLGDAIYAALPEVFKAQLELKLDREDLRELKCALMYASAHVTNQNALTYVLEGLAKMRMEDVETAKCVLISMCKIKDVSDDYSQLVSDAREMIASDLGKLKHTEVANVLRNVLKKCLKGDLKFYEPYFIDKLVDKITRDDCGFETGIFILSKLNKLKHVRASLLDYLAAKIQQDPSVIRSGDPNAIVTFVCGLSYANHLPDNWSEISETIIGNYNRLPTHVPLCYFALYLASMGCCRPELLKQIFIADRNPELLTKGYFETLRRVYQFARTLYRDYEGPWPIDEIVENFGRREFMEAKPLPLNYMMRKLLGGSEFVLNNVRTKLGHEIDHLIVLKDGCPIAVEGASEADSNSITLMDDLKIPPDCEKLAVLVLTPEVYSLNNKVLEATAMLNIKTLEAMSFKVVPVSYDSIYQRPDFEILPYLKSLLGIKSKKKVSQVN